MASLRTAIRSWETRATKLSSSIGWRGAWMKLCLHFKVWLRRNNKMADLRKNDPRKKKKTPPAGQTRNMGSIKPSRDRKESKAIPYT